MFLSPLAAGIFLVGIVPMVGHALGTALLYLYYPGYIATRPVIDAIPYKGWVVALLHVSLAMIVQNLIIWAIILMVLGRKRKREI